MVQLDSALAGRWRVSTPPLSPTKSYCCTTGHHTRKGLLGARYKCLQVV